MAAESILIMIALFTTAQCNNTEKPFVYQSNQSINLTEAMNNATEHESKDKDDVQRNSCDNLNLSHVDERESQSKISSMYLNNIYTGMTSLIEEVSGKIEVDGVSLFELVNSECGGTKICPSLSLNWTSENTITIGFLGAYGRSQVRDFYSFFKYF